MLPLAVAVWSRVRRLAIRVGRRGASLLFVGGLSLIIALSLLRVPPELRSQPAYQVLANIMPLPWWGVLWALACVLCLVQAFMRSDRMAFALASWLMFAYGIAYGIGSVTGDNPRGWVGAGVWVAFGCWITLISTWQETIALRHHPATQTNPLKPDDVVITADAFGNIRSWGKAATDMFGWAPGEIIGRPLILIMPERYRASHETALARVRHAGETRLLGQVVYVTGLHRDGTEFPLEVTLSVQETPGAGLTYSGVLRHCVPPEGE